MKKFDENFNLIPEDNYSNNSNSSTHEQPVETVSLEEMFEFVNNIPKTKFVFFHEKWVRIDAINEYGDFEIVDVTPEEIWKQWQEKNRAEKKSEAK